MLHTCRLSWQNSVAESAKEGRFKPEYVEHTKGSLKGTEAVRLLTSITTAKKYRYKSVLAWFLFSDMHRLRLRHSKQKQNAADIVNVQWCIKDAVTFHR